MVADVYAPRCDGCGACAEVCRVDAIEVSLLATIDPWRCTGCGQCVAVCPQEAISMRNR
jgi:MinD superfamily P-loop ATPase